MIHSSSRESHHVGNVFWMMARSPGPDRTAELHHPRPYCLPPDGLEWHRKNVVLYFKCTSCVLNVLASSVPVHFPLKDPFQIWKRWDALEGSVLFGISSASSISQPASMVWPASASIRQAFTPARNCSWTRQTLQYIFQSGSLLQGCFGQLNA